MRSKRRTFTPSRGPPGGFGVELRAAQQPVDVVDLALADRARASSRRARRRRPGLGPGCSSQCGQRGGAAQASPTARSKVWTGVELAPAEEHAAAHERLDLDRREVRGRPEVPERATADAAVDLRVAVAVQRGRRVGREDADDDVRAVDRLEDCSCERTCSSTPLAASAYSGAHSSRLSKCSVQAARARGRPRASPRASCTSRSDRADACPLSASCATKRPSGARLTSSSRRSSANRSGSSECLKPNGASTDVPLRQLRCVGARAARRIGRAGAGVRSASGACAPRSRAARARRRRGRRGPRARPKPW